jgi:hypothetical protein
MVSFREYAREYAASMRRQQIRNRRECIQRATEYMKQYDGADREALANSLSRQITELYGEEQIYKFCKGAVEELREMYLAGLLDDTTIDVGGCRLYRDYADTASSW